MKIDNKLYIVDNKGFKQLRRKKMSRRFLILFGLVLIMLTQTMMGGIRSDFEELKSC